MYNANAVLHVIDVHKRLDMSLFLLAAALSFVYFILAFQISITKKVYVVPFIGAALFFWHDLTFVLQYNLWFHVYDSWWMRMWWHALIGTVVLEAVMIGQVYLYGREESFPGVSKAQFGVLIILGTLGIGAMWFLVKATLQDPLFFVTFLITAVFSVPFHTGLMIHRRGSRGQSIIMQAVTIPIMWCSELVFWPTDPFFRSAPMVVFLAVFTLWPLVNIGLIRWLRAAEAGLGSVNHGAMGQVAK